MESLIKFTYFLFFLFSFTISCTQATEEKKDGSNQDIKMDQPFDPTQWRHKKGKDYPYRDKMSETVLHDPQLRKLKKEEVLDLLGPPDRVDSNYLFYMITQERLGPWPMHTKTLVVKVSQDSSLNKVMIHE